MDDHDVIQRIDKLVDEEHQLRSKGDGLSDDERARLRKLEEGLDQCWDLLRQRRARREVGDNPEDAQVRDVGTVEGYRQ
jgi:hypothetical protein